MLAMQDAAGGADCFTICFQSRIDIVDTLDKELVLENGSSMGTIQKLNTLQPSPLSIMTMFENYLGGWLRCNAAFYTAMF